MSFIVHDTTGISKAEVSIWLMGFISMPRGFDEVETGLSSGEIRQSILDRCREDVRRNQLVFNKEISKFFNKKQILTNQDLSLLTDKEKDNLIDEIEEVLYNLDDMEITGDWSFSNAKIYISHGD